MTVLEVGQDHTGHETLTLLTSKQQLRVRYHQPRRKETPAPVWRRAWTATRRASLLSLVPVLTWLPKYKARECLVGDLIAGLTISVLQIPHGLAFAQLARQEPVVGLYMAVFPVLVYALMGTSPHLSLGMQAILVVMVGNVVDQQLLPPTNSAGVLPSAAEVAVACTLAVGLWQVVMACAQLGSLCVLLSASLVSGLTTAAAIHIVFLQLKHVFGISLAVGSGPLKLIYASISLCENLPETNGVVLGLSVSMMAVLVFFNFYVKPRLAAKIPVPIPMEFILICVGVALSWALDLSALYGVAVVGTVPSGLPTPALPNMSLLPDVAVDALIIALVNVSINISVAKVFADKGQYSISEGQEVLAYGCANTMGSVWGCLPVCTALSRSALAFSLGARTPLVHLICLSSVLLMLLFLGAFFALVPFCVLASVVIVNMVPLLAQAQQLPDIWRRSRHDALIWLVTFIVVILVDLDYGIGAGLVTSIAVVLVSSAKANVVVLHKVESFFVDESYVSEDNSKQLLILQISGGLNFVNSSKLFVKVRDKYEKFILNGCDGVNQHVILDMSKVISMDPTAVAGLASFAQLIDSNLQCSLLLTGCEDAVYKQLEKCQFFSNFERDLVAWDLQTAYNYLTTSHSESQ